MAVLTSKTGDFAVYLKTGEVFTIYRNQENVVADEVYTSDPNFATEVFKSWLADGHVIVTEAPAAKSAKQKAD